MGTRNPAYTSDYELQVNPVMSSYAKDTPIIDPALSYTHEPDHTYLAPRIPGYNTDDVILQCKKENVYDSLGMYSDTHKVEGMRKANLFYEPTQVRGKPLDKTTTQRPRSRKKKNRFCLLLLLLLISIISLGAFTVTLLQYFGMLKCNGSSSNGGSTQSGTGASTGTIDLERLKQLESNITALKQKIAPQQVQIASLINSTLQNERTIKLLREALDSEKARTRNLNNTINSLGMTLESEQAKSWNMNQTMKNYEARLIDEERKTMEHSKTLLQLRALHDALKNATSMTSQALAANITELNSRLEEILSTMQSINQTTNIANLQSMIEKESIHRKGNDSVLFALVNSSTVARQESVAALTSDISAVKRMSMQNISNLEARLSSSINTQVTRLGTDDQILFSQVSNVNQTLLQMIQNVSLTPGPQGPTGPSGPMGAVGPVGPTGPAGAGNLTDCNEHSDSISTTAISVNVIGTYSKTTRQLMGYTCYATVPAGISFADDPIGKRCTCDAVSAPGKLWTCKITVFTCPKTS